MSARGHRGCRTSDRNSSRLSNEEVERADEVLSTDMPP